jgi:hypothetical protein
MRRVALAIVVLGACAPGPASHDGGGPMDSGRVAPGTLASGDAGVADAGPLVLPLPRTCAAPEDCTSLHPGPRSAFCEPDAGGWSCLLGQCVFECAGGRICQASSGSTCLSCNGGETCMERDRCPLYNTLIILESSCGVGRESWPTDRRDVDRCEATVGWRDRPLGNLRGYTVDVLLAEFPAFGGACVGQRDPSSTSYRLACPSCAAVVLPTLVGP